MLSSLLSLALLGAYGATQSSVDVRPTFATAAVGTDPDDPAIWVHPTHPERSLILGTDKTKAPEGGLFVFDLEGRVVQHIPNLDRPNNVDVEVGLKFGRNSADIAVVTERLTRRLRIFRIDPRTRLLTDVSGETDVFKGEEGDNGAPMGVGLYRRPKDGAIFAIVTPKEGPTTNHLGQYRLNFNPATGKVDAALVRRFGNYSGVKETESVFVDDALGFVYYSDETVGTRKYQADPDAANPGKELGFFNRTGTKGDHEGIALWARPDGTGFLVCTDQIAGNTVYRVFRREGSNAFLGSFRGGADETDGIEVLSTPLGKQFPKGIMVAMNSGPKNFLVYDWNRIAQGLGLRL